MIKITDQDLINLKRLKVQALKDADQWIEKLWSILVRPFYHENFVDPITKEQAKKVLTKLIKRLGKDRWMFQKELGYPFFVEWETGKYPVIKLQFIQSWRTDLMNATIGRSFDDCQRLRAERLKEESK